MMIDNRSFGQRSEITNVDFRAVSMEVTANKITKEEITVREKCGTKLLQTCHRIDLCG